MAHPVSAAHQSSGLTAPVLILGGLAAIFVLLRFGRPFLKSLWFGRWALAATGEMHRVVGQDYDGPVLDGTTRGHRRAVAAFYHKERLQRLAALLALVVTGVLGLVHFWTVSGVVSFVVTLYSFLAIIFGVLAAIPDLIKELLYWSGFQRMEGARVLDAPAPPPPGKEVLDNADAYGRARPAGIEDISDVYAARRAGEATQRFRD